MRKHKDLHIKPCDRCTRVRDPENCENKNCVPWRQWYAYRWELLRKQYGLTDFRRQGERV